MASTASLLNTTTNQCPPRESQVKKRAPRRRVKREGPLQLQFLTATDPSHFKNEDTRRSVRSQAMVYHRSKPKKQAVLHRERAEGSVTQEGPIVSVLVDEAPCHGHHYGYTPGQLEQSSRHQQHGNATTLRTSWNANTSAQLERTPKSHQRLPAIRARPRLAKVQADSKDDEHPQTQEERVLRRFMDRIETVYQLGDGVDPFHALPSYKNSKVNSLYLKRNCIRIFASDMFNVKWLPAMLSYPDVLLSSSIIAAIWLDMHEKRPGDSQQTALLKAEIFDMIKARLQNPKTQSSDSTIMVVLHLLTGEIFGSNEVALRVHEHGLARLLLHRGGLSRLTNVPLAETCAGCCYHGNLISEAEPLPVFATFQPAADPNMSDGPAVLPESPLFCPSDFATIVNDPRCSTFTCNILRDMRDLTDLFIAHESAMEIQRDASEVDAAYTENRDIEYNSMVTAIRKRLTRLPSAHVSNLPTSNDWVYEACRIAALIYAASIILRLPISDTAEPCQNPLVAESEASYRLEPGASLLNTRLSEALFNALQHTPVADLWDNMSGVFYWVSTVGAAAARSPAVIYETPQWQSREEKWSRRCLVNFSTRAMIKLVFDHSKPVLMSQKKLLKIQQLVARHDECYSAWTGEEKRIGYGSKAPPPPSYETERLVGGPKAAIQGGSVRA